jgi:hypothetical protein
MINTKAFAIVVVLVIGLVTVGLYSLPADGQVLEAPAMVDVPLAPAVDDPGLEPSGLRMSGDHLPLMVRWSNWQPAFGPAIVYAREADLNGMLELNGPLEKMLMTTSYDEVQRLMAMSDQLRAAGVTTIGINTENGQGMTPGSEMATLDSADPQVNVVARVAQLARENGFKVTWGPVRVMTDNVSDAAIRSMMAAGLSGLAIQEQKFIESQPAAARLTAVNRTRDRYLRLAELEGVDDFSFHVQIMQQRCPDLSNCVAFVEGLEQIPVDSIAIWSNGPIPADFVSAIRME